MSLKHHLPVAICPSREIGELGKFALTIEYRGQKRDAILVRFQGTVYGYLNQCVHMPKALDCEHQHIFDDSNRYLQCSMHSICYDPVTGESLSEICRGKKLTGFKVREEDGWVFLADKKAAMIA